MTGENNSNDPIYIAYAFFASSSFAALFFVLQAKTSLPFPDIIITFVAIGSTLLFFATIGRINITRNLMSRHSVFSKAVSYYALVGIGFLFVSICLIVFAFSIIGGITVVSVMVGSLYFLNTLANRS